MFLFLYIMVLLFAILGWFVSLLIDSESIGSRSGHFANNKEFAAFYSLLFFAAVAWPLTLTVALLGFLGYGLYNAVQMRGRMVEIARGK